MCIVTRSGYDLSDMVNDILDAGFYIAELNNDLSSTKVRKTPAYQKYLKQRHTPKQLFLRSHKTQKKLLKLYLHSSYYSL